MAKGGNITEENLWKIITGYSSHNYVIDREEAKAELFLSVEGPTEEERKLEKYLEGLFLTPKPIETAEPVFSFLSTEIPSIFNKDTKRSAI